MKFQTFDFLIIGSGLAGAACADVLAARGYSVSVLSCETGASHGLPAGLLAAHLAWPDIELSQITRQGLMLTWQHCTELLQLGIDWQPIELRQKLLWSAERNARWRQAADALPDWFYLDGQDIIHRRAAWVRPAALAKAWLVRSNATNFRASVKNLKNKNDLWQALDGDKNCIAQAAQVVIAAGTGSQTLAKTAGFDLGTDDVSGQVAFGQWREEWAQNISNNDIKNDSALRMAVNGNGHFLSSISIKNSLKKLWLSGSSYERAPFANTVDLQINEGLKTNRKRLNALLTNDLIHALEQQFLNDQVQTWRGSRCTHTSRLPLVKILDRGLFTCTALGSRGLCFSALAAQQLLSFIEPH